MEVMPMIVWPWKGAAGRDQCCDLLLGGWRGGEGGRGRGR